MSCTHLRNSACFQDLRTNKRFCSKRCMQVAFKTLGEQHNRHKTRAAGNTLENPQEVDFDPTDHAVWDVKPFQEDNQWIEVGKDRNYVPMSKDVGHVLVRQGLTPFFFCAVAVLIKDYASNSCPLETRGDRA